MADVTSTLTHSFTYQTLDGTNIADGYVTTGALALGANTVDLPTNITKSPLAVIPVTLPDAVVVTVTSWSLVGGIVKVVLNAAATAASGVTLVVKVGVD